MSNAFYHLSLARKQSHPGGQRSGLSYSTSINSVYLGMKPSALTKLQLVQKALICLLSNTGYLGRIRPVLCSLHWLLIEHWIKFKVSVIIFKMLQSLGPGISKRLSKALRWRLWSTTLLLWHNGTLYHKSKARLCRRQNFLQVPSETVEWTAPGTKDSHKPHYLLYT